MLADARASAGVQLARALPIRNQSAMQRRDQRGKSREGHWGLFKVRRRRRLYPFQCDSDFWTCPFCGGRDLSHGDDAYRLGGSRLFECINPACRQLVSESALAAASAKRRQTGAQSSRKRN
jgi:hypothetical protein